MSTERRFAIVIVSIVLLGLVIGAILMLRVNVPSEVTSIPQPATEGHVILGIAHIGDSAQKQVETRMPALEAQFRHKIALDSAYYDWNDLGGTFMDWRIATDTANGRVFMASWRPTITDSSDNTKLTCANATDIASGKYDAQITSQAEKLKSYGTTILLRWNYEMSDNDYNYCFNGYKDLDDATAGPLYVQAWQHIHDLFAAAGATNVQWIWAPGAGLFTHKADGSLDDIDWKYYYPGDAYVDWIAEDNYNKTNTPQKFGDDPDIAHFYSQVAGKGKPLMQSETGACDDPSQYPNDPQTVWIASLEQALETKYPAFKAVVWWQGFGTDGKCTKDGHAYEIVPSSPGYDAFQALARDPYFSLTSVGTSSAVVQ